MAEYNPSKIIKDGNTYNFRDTTKIPLAGSNAISGSLVPSATDTYNFGSPSYQWSNAYIKSLILKGASTRREIYASTEGVIGLYGAGTVPESSINPYRFYVGKARNYAGAPIVIDTTMTPTGSTSIALRAASNESENVIDHRFYIGTSVIDNNDGTKVRNAYVQFYNTNEIKPNKDNYCDLGTSSYKWKNVNTNAINGINPDALSLPSTARVKLDTTNFVWDGVTQNVIEPPVPCILYILVTASKIAENGTISAGNTYMYTSSQIIKNNVSNCGANNNYAIASVQANAGDRVVIRLSLLSSLSGSEGVFYRPLLGNVLGD